MLDIDIHLLRIKCSPQYFPLARNQCDRTERKRRARPIDVQNIRFACTLGEDLVKGEEHARILGIRTLAGEIKELRGRRRYVVHNKIGNKVDGGAQGLDIFPGSQAGIHLSVIDRVKSSISTVNRGEKGQKVRSTKDSGQRPFQQAIQFGETSAGKAVDVCNELNLVFHDFLSTRSYSICHKYVTNFLTMR